MRATALSAPRRERDLASLAAGADLDVLVVGGGVTGAGIAIDAATRGLRTALVERHDLAFGTSRWSSKLIHGGLRYLPHGDVGLAYESARERAILMERTAPHLVHAAPFVVPITPAVSRKEERLVLVGTAVAGEMLRLAARTRRATLPKTRRISPDEARRLAPELRAEGLRGALLSYDGQLEDDARLVVTLARTAAGIGARILTAVEATAVTATGAHLRDTRTGAELDVTARAVVNATGVWADRLDAGISLRPSRGSHLVLRSERLGNPTVGLTIPIPGMANRYLLLIPQPDGTSYLGLTDDPLDGPVPDVPEVPAQDEEFLLGVVNTVLETPLTRADVVGRFAGLRPLAAGSGSTADLSRKHVLHRADGGPLTVYGGKLTTYRRMAQDAVDALALTTTRCRTATYPLVGAAPRDELARLAQRLPARLVRRYGIEAVQVAALADDDPGLREPVAPGLPVLRVELAWGVLEEGALTVEDLLERRTRLALVPADAYRARPAAEDILARYLDRAAALPT